MASVAGAIVDISGEQAVVYEDAAYDRSASGAGRWHAAAIRIVDVAISLLLLAFLAPLMTTIACLVRATDQGPVFFGHRRIGKHGREFHCLKFRSMVVDARERLAHLLATDEDAHAEWAKDHKLRNDPRVTPLGRFLRRSSLDELPQLINVLRGEMSLVGPRPIVREEVRHYGRRFDSYSAVRPGITGLWQISGRNDVSYRRRVAFDVSYARSQSLALYCRILFLTVPSVLVARGSY